MALPELLPFYLASAAYLLAAFFYTGGLAFSKPSLFRWGWSAAAGGLLASTAVVIVRAIAAGHGPFANMYEFGALLVVVVVSLFLGLDFRYRCSFLGAFVLPLVFVFSGLLPLLYQEAGPLGPALRSNWLVAHAITAVVAYGALTMSFCAAIAYHWCRRSAGRRGETGRLERLVTGLISFSVPFLTLLIVTGAIWAEYAWGSYWRWDPKETWSLITWLVYVLYLHMRSVYGWRGLRAVNLAILGFLVLVFTFVGVNLLLPGIHSYASGP